MRVTDLYYEYLRLTDLYYENLRVTDGDLYYEN